MPFDVKLCPKETCDGLRLVDITGYFSSENPFGYNAPAPGTPTLNNSGVFNYVTYNVQIFFAQQGGFDDEGTPNISFNLLTWPHTVDPATGYVTWNFTFEELGVTTMRSGQWLFRTFVTLAPSYDYSNDYIAGFVEDIKSKVDATGLDKPLDCDCQEGCDGPWAIMAKLDYTVKQGCCRQASNFQRNVDWLYLNYLKCC